MTRWQADRQDVAQGWAYLAHSHYKLKGHFLINQINVRGTRG